MVNVVSDIHHIFLMQKIKWLPKLDSNQRPCG